MARVAVAAGPVTPLPLRAGPRGRHVVDTTLLFAPTSGGVRRYLLTKHQWLCRYTRIKHTVFVPGRDDAGLPYGLMSFGSPPLPLAGGYRVPVRLRAFRERLARLTPDLIEVGDPYHVAWQALQVARQCRVPSVAFCHSDVISVARSLFGSAGGRAASRYLQRLYAGFDLVLAPSAALADRIDAAGVRNVEIQPLGVDAATLTPAARDPSLRQPLGIAPGARLLVFAGRLSPEKRTRDLLAAARLLGPRFHLLLVGGDRTARLAPNVSALPYQRELPQLARILASCDAFVHAGDQETFGLVALEAMACGLPVVAARAGALVELVDETVGATFQPRDPADLAHAVVELFERDLAALATAARARAAASSWDRAFTQLLGRYTRLMNTAVPGPRRLRHAV